MEAIMKQTIELSSADVDIKWLHTQKKQKKLTHPAMLNHTKVAPEIMQKQFHETIARVTK